MRISMSFLTQNKSWLVPYAAFCYLKETNGTADFRKWKTYGKYSKLAIDRLTSPQSKQYDQIAYFYFVQYHLYRQLRKSVVYAHENGIIIKGDIPIGVYRYSSDAWVSPELYHMDQQAGAPPDPFAVKGPELGLSNLQLGKDGKGFFSMVEEPFFPDGHLFRCIPD